MGSRFPWETLQLPRKQNHFLRDLQLGLGLRTARPIENHCAYSSHKKTCCFSAGQGRIRKHLHRTKKIGLYFRGVDYPPLQSISIDVLSYDVIESGNKQIFGCCITQHQRRKYTKTPAGIVAKVRPRRTIVQGGSRVTRGKRSVFPERYLMSQSISTMIKSSKTYEKILMLKTKLGKQLCFLNLFTFLGGIFREDLFIM